MRMQSRPWFEKTAGENWWRKEKVRVSPCRSVVGKMVGFCASGAELDLSIPPASTRALILLGLPSSKYPRAFVHRSCLAGGHRISSSTAKFDPTQIGQKPH